MPPLASILAVCVLLIGVGPAWAQGPETSQKVTRQKETRQKETSKMSDIIAVDLQSPQAIPLDGPVPVVATVKNLSPSAVSILLPYPNPNNLGFRSLTEGFASPKVVEKNEIERTAPITIEASRQYSVTYYLNRYFAFQRAGAGYLEYTLNIRVIAGEVSNSHAFSGRFGVDLAVVSDVQLREALAVYSARLRSPNRQETNEAAEALAYLNTPAVLPYLMPMLQIDNLEVTGIHALGRHPSFQSGQAIKSMLTHQDSAVVEAALREIDRLKIQTPRSEVQQLLRSSNSNTQWLALGWLAARPSREDLPLLRPLLDSDSQPVRDRARGYSASLR
jgi:hypothetical protein